MFIICDDNHKEEISSINSLFINQKINVIQNLGDIDKSRNLLLCVISGKVTKNKIIDITNLLEISKVSVNGWIFINQ